MTEVKTYLCDRCRKTFTKPIGEKPSQVTREDETYVPDVLPHIFQLCDECIIEFWNWEIHDEDFDKFSASMTKKWEKEADS